MRFDLPRSLITRILLAEGLTIMVVAVVLPVLMVLVLQGTATRYLHETLATQAMAIADATEVDTGGASRVDLKGALRPIYASGYDGRSFAIVDAAGRHLTASPLAHDLQARRDMLSPRQTFFREGSVIGVSMPIVRAGHRLWVIVRQDETGPGAILDDVAKTFLWRFLPIFLPILLLLPLVNSLAVRKLVLGVRSASQRAAEIAPRNLHIRLEERNLPDEVKPLVRATNLLLDRVEASFQQQGEFSANVAHELRTPLAALRVRLDAIADPTLRASLDAQVARMSHVISQLLDLVSLERIATDKLERFDLQSLAEDVIGQIAPDVLAAGDTIDLFAPEPVFVRGSVTLIRLALTNLVSNAIRHTPAGTVIVVSIGADSSISVSDNGPGIALEDRYLLVRRFWRADRKRSDGAGIGLSIVQRIVDVHDARLDICNAPGGGATFAINLRPSD